MRFAKGRSLLTYLERLDSLDTRQTFRLILIVAVVLRLPMLGYSFFGDEWFSLLRDSSQFLTTSEDRFRPLFFSLLYLWRQIGFSGEIMLRLLPLIFGLLQIPVAYQVGKELRSERLGHFFALLVALSPVLIEFSTELRMYSLVALIALLQLLMFLRLQCAPKLSRWIVFILIALAGVYTHLFYWLYLVGFAFSFWRVRSSLPIWKSIAAMVAVVALYLPNIPNLLDFAARRSSEYPLHLPSALPKLLAAFTVGFNYFSLPDQGSGRAIDFGDLWSNLLYLIPVLIAGWIFLRGFIRLHSPEHRSPALSFGHELFTIPVVLALIASLVTGKYFLQPKYLIFSAPGALLFFAALPPALETQQRRKLLAGLGVLIFLIAILHTWMPFDYGRKENWRGAASFLNKSLTPDAVLLTLPGGYHLLDYYAPNLKTERIVIDSPSGLASDYRAVEQLRESIAGAETVFYLYWDTAQNFRDPRNELIKALDRLRGGHNILQLNPRLKIYSWSEAP